MEDSKKKKQKIEMKRRRKGKRRNKKKKEVLQIIFRDLFSNAEEMKNRWYKNWTQKEMWNTIQKLKKKPETRMPTKKSSKIQL